MDAYDYKIEKLERIGSVLISLLLLSKNFLQLSSFIFGNTTVFKAIFVLLGIYALIKFHWVLYKKDAVLFLIVFLFFVGTYIFNDNSSLLDNLIYFLIYGLAGYAYSFCLVRESLIIKNCTLIGLFWLLLYLYNNNFIITDGFSFGYLMLPLAISSFLWFAQNNQHLLSRIFKLIIFVICSLLIFFNGSRGPIACYVMSLMIYAFQFIKYSNKKVPILIMFFLVFLLILNYRTIIVGIYNAFPGKISFIDKSYILLSMENGITNGRIGIVESIFKEYDIFHLLTGIGIGTYESTHIVEGYTHNVVFSLLLDFGLIGIVIICQIFYKVFSLIYRYRDDYLVLLFSTSVLPLMFSGTYWQSFPFWLLIFTCAKITKKV